MTGLRASLAVESRKLVASRVVRSATVLLVAGVAVLAGSLTWAAGHGNEQVLAKLGPLAAAAGWDRFLGVAAQVTAAGVLLGFGVVLSWVIGREFADGTVAGLFALPVRRSATALAKILVFLCWAAGVAVLLGGVLAVVGTALDLGPLGASAGAALARQVALTVLSAGLAVPVAWASTVGRGLLPGIATAVAILVIAQVAVVAGAGGWLPFAAPALWAFDPGAVSGVQLALAGAVPLLSGLATLAAWQRLQLDH